MHPAQAADEGLIKKALHLEGRKACDVWCTPQGAGFQ
jgi:hypothetical protein